MVMQVKYALIVRIILVEYEKKGIDYPSKVSLISEESELHHSIGSLIGRTVVPPGIEPRASGLSR